MTDRAGAAGAGPSVKICGLTRPEDALFAASAGADYLGAVLAPGSPRAVSPAEARALAEPTGLPLVLVTVDHGVDRLVRDAREAGAEVLQLHGAEGPPELERLRGEGDWLIWKAMRLRGGEALAQAAERISGFADGLLLDGWHPERHGGTGVRFAWDEVEAIRNEIPVELELVVAGGLLPENVGVAVQRMRPDVVDVSSGVELRPGVKDPERVRAFIEAARAAGALG